MKTFITSKTMWFGMAQITFGAIGYVTGWINHVDALALIGLGFGTIGLRFKTTMPIEG